MSGDEKDITVKSFTRFKRRIVTGLRHWLAGIVVVAALCCLLLAGCAPLGASVTRTAATPTTRATSHPPAGPLDHSVATTGCGRAAPVAPGSSGDQTLAVDPASSNGAHTRTYRLHLPATYRGDKPLPVVLAFHGYGGSAADMETSSGFSALADLQGILAVYPQGLLFPGDHLPFWASAGPVDAGIDDIRFVSQVLDDLQRTLCVAPMRIYATGFSNGGGMTGYLACRLSGRIAAFAPAAGNFYAVPGGCTPSRPAPILDFHGTADPVVPYSGIPAAQNPQWPLPSIPKWLEGWATRDGCTGGPAIFLRVPGVTGEQWTRCRDGADVIHYRLENGGHTLPATLAGRATTGVIWQFFQAHPLPGA
jgi:polyhydroxybutyrate depolymerase